ncbi:hypothetical protein OG978_32540 [Streptomyces sp. NBC_01591]|uniref:hypothetical protein n=1 Tax=Streptomyces sp. NBC_01591 TaxID=2975888 RepID=UPI002DDA1499|nr:hypothetical protein [Streptomyces sp. NBC_01591]WSD71703.1 hypothetical protein OG978_32540 [Streptomyces sp. NBC_01591]
MHVALEWLAVEALAELPDDQARGEVQGVIDEVARDRSSWPAAGGEEAVDVFGSRCWVTVAAFADGLEVRDVGWCGPGAGATAVA